MINWSALVRTEFLSAGWQELVRPIVTDGRLQGLFMGGFAVCGVRVAESSVEVIGAWPELQAAIAELKTEDLKDRARDYYLIFVVRRVDEASLPELQRILDDTLVCRKICLELLGRTLGETLGDIPFFSTPGTLIDFESPMIEAPPLDGIPEAVQRDLELKSPERILEALIDGSYENR